MASKHYHIKFNFDHDKEIIDRIESKENKNDYIRGLVLSDIAADILRDSIKLEGDMNQDSDSESDRIYTFNEWMEKNCKAFNTPDEQCDGCPYIDYPSLGTDVHACIAGSAYEKYVEDLKNG